MRQYPEYNLQKQVCSYLQKVYPNVLFLSEGITHTSLTITQANRNKAIQKTGFNCPDLCVFEPNNIYKGLFIELKAKCPYKLNGELKKDTHLQEQQSSINKLLQKGYYATFGWDFEQIKIIIDNYINNTL